MTDQGLRGPVRWLIRLEDIPPYLVEAGTIIQSDDDVWWVQLAEESRPHAFEPFGVSAQAILAHLSTMER